MHGVGGERRRCGRSTRAGLPAPVVVDEQFAARPDVPDGVVPEPGGAGGDGPRRSPWPREQGAALAIANDPDADRLGAAIPQPDGSWRRLGGDEIGWLLADHILDQHRRATTGWSSRRWCRRRCSATMAADHGVHFAETFTGFKWIGAGRRSTSPSCGFVFGYEQALGYLVAPRPLDKDGISAAVLLAEIAAVAAEEGTTLQGRLDDIAARYGRHVIAERSVRMDPAEAAERVRELQADPPSELGGAEVVDVTAYPGGRPAAARARGRRAGAGPPERHRAEGQALRRSRRRRPHPLPRRPRRASSPDEPGFCS